MKCQCLFSEKKIRKHISKFCLLKFLPSMLSLIAHAKGGLIHMQTVKPYLFMLRFYGPVNPVRSCRVQSVYLTALLLGRLSPLSG